VLGSKLMGIVNKHINLLAKRTDVLNPMATLRIEE